MRSEGGAYPVLIKQYQDDYLVYIPGWDIYTEGQSMADAIAMARDAIGLKWLNASEENADLRKAMSGAEALECAKREADEDFDYSDGILSYVDIDFTAYKAKMRNRAVKKNCTIPYWLNEEAERQGLNFSKVLQEALIKKLNVG